MLPWVLAVASLAMILALACDTSSRSDVKTTVRVGPETAPFPVATEVATETPFGIPTPFGFLQVCDDMPCLALATFPESFAGEVLKAVDGDTVVVLLRYGSILPVSLLGVDTPETQRTNKPDEYDGITDIACLDKWGILATQFTAEALKGQTIEVALGFSATYGGAYQWVVGYVKADGRDFNAVLVEEGYARADPEADSDREQEYQLLEERARAQGIGLWEC